MTEPYAKAAEVIAGNIDDFMAEGSGLSTRRRTVVLAYDPERQMVKLGGLGAMGVGTMWSNYRPADHDITGAPHERGYTLMETLDAFAQFRDNPPTMTNPPTEDTTT